MEENTLDDTLVAESAPDPRDIVASSGQRLANYIIDTIAYYILVFLIFALMGLMGIFTEEPGTLITYAIAISIAVLYYFFFESVNGKTPGKMITGTRAVDHKGMPMDNVTTLKRSLCRFIPFDAFSFLGTRGWHDSITDTYVIKDKK